MPNHGAGGRPKGARNKRSQGLLAEIKRQFPNYDPLMHLASVAADENNDVKLRMDASTTICQYVYPKLKAVEMSGDGGGPLVHHIILEPHTSIEGESVAPTDDKG